MINYRAAMVDLIEKVYGFGAGRGQLENLVQEVENTRNADRMNGTRKGKDVRANPAVMPLVLCPSSFATLLGFISTEVPYMGGKCETILSNSGRPAAIAEGARLLKNFNESLKQLVKTMTTGKPWIIEKGPIDVVRVWRDRRDEMTGAPQLRKMAQDSIPLKKANYVLIQGESGATHPYLCVTSDFYNLDESTGKDYREDFLIDVCKYIEQALDDSGGTGNWNTAPSYKMGLFLEKFLNDFVDFYDAGDSLANFMRTEGVKDFDPEGLYGVAVGMAEALKGGVVSAEDNPDAKYTIGEFA